MRVIDVRSCLCRNRQRQAVWRLRTRSRWQCNYKSLYTHCNTCYTRHASRGYTKGFSKLYAITYHKITRTTRFMIRRHLLSCRLKQAACDTRASRCVETLIRCTRVAADAPWMKRILIPRGYAISHGRERKERWMDPRNRGETWSSRFCNANHRARVIRDESYPGEEETSRFKSMSHGACGFSGINICPDAIMYI